MREKISQIDHFSYLLIKSSTLIIDHLNLFSQQILRKLKVRKKDYFEFLELLDTKLTETQLNYIQNVSEVLVYEQGEFREDQILCEKEILKENSTSNYSREDLFRLGQELIEQVTSLVTDIEASALKVLEEESSNTELITIDAHRPDPFEAEEESMELISIELPRSIIEISSELLQTLKFNDWKARLEGLDEIETLLVSTNMRILPVGLEPLVEEMVKQIYHNRPDVAHKGLILSEKFAEALGPESNIFAKHFVSPIILSGPQEPIGA